MIGEFIRAHLAPVQECYDRRLAAMPKLRGRLIIRVDIGGEGKVLRAAADGMVDRKLVDCVVEQALDWKFAKPPSGWVPRAGGQCSPWSYRSHAVGY